MTEPLPPLLDLSGFEELTAGTGLPALRLAAVIREVRDYCGWHIAPAVDETFVLDGSGATVQQVPTLCLNSVDTVEENGQAVTEDCYEWSRDGSLRRHVPWTCRLRGVEVTVNHGFAEVPENILSVVLDAASNAISTPVGVDAEQPETMGPFTFGGGKGVVLNAAHRRILDRYALPFRP